jgi:DNA-binding NarL/FixJ family response regulator
MADRMADRTEADSASIAGGEPARLVVALAGRADRRPRVAIFSRTPRLCGRVGASVQSRPDLGWVGRVDTVGRAIRLCQLGRADVLLIDSASDLGWKLCLLISRLFPGVAVVVLLANEHQDEVKAAWAVLHGARGLIEADADPAHLGLAIRNAAKTSADMTRHGDSRSTYFRARP